MKFQKYVVEIIYSVVFTLICFTCVNCATLMSNSGERYDVLRLDSIPEKASYIIYDKHDKVIAKGETPIKVLLKGSFPFKVEVSLEDYETRKYVIKKRINSNYWRNIPMILVAGSGLLGLVLDPIKHKVIEIYPNHIYTKLQLSQEGIIARHNRMLQEKGLTEEEWQAQEQERKRREEKEKLERERQEQERKHREEKARLEKERQEEMERQERMAVSKLIQNILDVGVKIGESFTVGEIVSIPYGLFKAIDYSVSKNIHSYLVIMNDYTTPSKPFYIETTRQLDTIGPLRIQYVRTAQYYDSRVPRSTLVFKEVR